MVIHNLANWAGMLSFIGAVSTTIQLANGFMGGTFPTSLLVFTKQSASAMYAFCMSTHDLGLVRPLKAVFCLL
jgi:hypothetical protein